MGDTVTNGSYCNLVWHQMCAGLAAVPDGYFMCPGCVLAEVTSQGTNTHGADVEDRDDSENDDDGEMGGGFESTERLEKRPLLLAGYSELLACGKLRMLMHFVARLITTVRLMPTSLTEVDMMLWNISKGYGTPLLCNISKG